MRPENSWDRHDLLALEETGPGPEVQDPVEAGPILDPAQDSPKPSGDSGKVVVRQLGKSRPLLTAWYASDRQRVSSVPLHRQLPSWEGPVRRQFGAREEDFPATASWWWLGVHGGAGVSTLERFLPGGADAERRWPDPGQGGPSVVVLVCRTQLTGLERARDAARQWAAADVPAGLLLGGAVAVADAPGRLARSQSEALRLLAGAVPRLWTVPWIEELRAVPEPGGLRLPPGLVRIGRDLGVLQASDVEGSR